jgi:hypothetical protein
LDILQNIGELILLFCYPTRLLNIAQVSSVVTTLKMPVGCLSSICVLVASGFNVVLYIKRQKKMKN